MKKNRINHPIHGLVILLFLLGACSDFLDPVRDSSLTEDEIWQNSYYFNGPLNAAYNALDATFNIAMDNMTDNSVNREYSGDYYLCGIGALNPNRNPLNSWDNDYQQIRRLNQFLEKMVLNPDPDAPLRTPVRWYYPNRGDENNIQEFYRLIGEAHFLRAYYLHNLVKNFAGVTADGDTLGVPLVGNRVVQANEDLNIPRSTYKDCVDAIVADCDTAIKYLKSVEYQGSDLVWGQRNNGRASGISARALKARVLLYAASPAYNKNWKNDKSKWEEAAIAAADAIMSVQGGFQDLINARASANDDLGTMYYHGIQNNTNWQANMRDIFFRANIQTGNRAYETNNYPPSMYGNAQNNPSQNFVDAFPDINGYPIDAEGTVYDPANPYVNRDPRLALYVAYNSSKMGPDGYHTIETYEGGEDGFNLLKGTSRTGYYLRKLLRTGTINLTPNVPGTNSTNRVNIILGKPELYLTFAEAANEAWGVTGDPNGYGFTARDVLVRIHKKFNSGNGYLNNVIGNNTDMFRDYIRNCRRLELSFEGHYYYDLRRWISDGTTKMLNVDIYKVGNIVKKDNNTYEYGDPELLEKRYFRSPYQPIPYMELYNARSIKQNAGWE
mgnify:CR=1 FL=1